jgi:nucleotide-binding universal stress UspA family protein
MFHRIFVPVDGSDPSERAVSLALELARESEAAVFFCHVVDRDYLLVKEGTTGWGPGEIQCRHEEMAALLDGFVQRAASAGVHAESAVLDGNTVHRLLESATSWHADLILMGSHGRRGAPRFFLGSIAEGVLRASEIPVLTVRAPRHEPTRAGRGGGDEHHGRRRGADG